MVENKSNFYTLKGYQLNENCQMTSAMEDYLEMICRLEKTQPTVRINLLASKLNVKPSSASKMVNNLKNLDLVYFEKYGYIKTTKKGKIRGNYLLHRHDVLNKFLCIINDSENELEQVEKIEHFINEKTIDNIEKFIERKSK